MANENNGNVVLENEGTGINWAKCAVRDTHGALDVDATMALCAEELAAHVAQNEVDMSEIATAIDGVFSKLTRNGEIPSASIDLDGLATRALSMLKDVPFGGETQLKRRVMDYVRGESQLFVETNGAEGKCVISRGKLGGCRPATAKVVEDYRAFQAKKLAAAAK